jgi:hypothetical protein
MQFVVELRGFFVFFRTTFLFASIFANLFRRIWGIGFLGAGCLRDTKPTPPPPRPAGHTRPRVRARALCAHGGYRAPRERLPIKGVAGGS